MGWVAPLQTLFVVNTNYPPVAVDLTSESAVVLHDPVLVTPEGVRDCVNNIGPKFTCRLAGEKDSLSAEQVYTFLF